MRQRLPCWAASYGKDRLTKPLLARWRTAIEKLVAGSYPDNADRIQAAPERFAFYGSGQWTIPEGYAAQKFMKGGLSNNHIDPNARLCMASAVTGFLQRMALMSPQAVMTT